MAASVDTTIKQKIRVLYAEDDAGLVDLLQDYMEEREYHRVFEWKFVRDGADALEAISSTDFDIIVLDHNMPRVSGLEVLRQIKEARQDFPPIIMLTGAGNEELAVEAMRHGAADYVIKDLDGRYITLLPMIMQHAIQTSLFEQQAKKAALALQLEHKRSQLLATFIEKASHEFRTPLTLIDLSSDLIERYILRGNTDRIDKYINQIRQQSKSILALVNNLLLIVELDSEPALDLRPVSIGAVLGDITKELLQSDKYESMTFVVETEAWDQIGSIYADKHLLFVALREILKNAIENSPEDSTISAICTVESDRLLLTIADQGSGLSADQINRVFERFFRVNEAHTERGFGLGLPIAQRIIQLHQGHIWINSQLGTGTSVVVEFPYITPKTQSS